MTGSVTEANVFAAAALVTQLQSVNIMLALVNSNPTSIIIGLGIPSGAVQQITVTPSATFLNRLQTDLTALQTSITNQLSSTYGITQ